MIVVVVITASLPIVLAFGFMVYVEATQPYYINKSTAEHQADEARRLSELAEACAKAGHNWEDGRCLANFPQPEMDWYKQPELNQSWVQLWDIAVVVLILSIAIGLLNAFIVVRFWSKRDIDLAKSRISKLSSTLGTPESEHET